MLRLKALLVACLALSASVVNAGLAEQTYSKYVSSSGEMVLPADYRTTWAHIGSWLVEDKKAPGHGFHDVYMQPEAVAAYRRTGEYPDGAILIKEVRQIQEGPKTTGQAQWAGDVMFSFVMVKDTKGRFKGNKHWAEGWGWSLFKPGESKNSSESFQKTCLGCHTPAKGNDWVFIEGYPTLTEVGPLKGVSGGTSMGAH